MLRETSFLVNSKKESYLVAKGVFISYLVQCPIASHKENKHLKRAIHSLLRTVSKTPGLGGTCPE